MRFKKTLLFAAGSLLAIAPVIWSLLASKLAANEVVTVKNELHSYLICFLWVLFYAIASMTSARSLSRKAIIIRIMVYSFLGIIVLVAWLNSNKMFMYWKIKATTPRKWALMASELNQTGRKLALNGDDNYSIIGSISILPKDFSKLGEEAEFFTGFAQIGLEETNQLTARVAYGYQTRRWGLYIGSEKFLTNRWPAYSIIPVSGGAYFFTGPD